MNKHIKIFRRVGYFTKEGIIIWYILVCQGQDEQQILDSCRGILSGKSLTDAFVLTYDRMRRYEGNWHLEKCILFPERVFLESSNEKALRNALRHCQNIMEQKISLIRLEIQDEMFLRDLCGKEKHMKMSRGVIQKGGARVTEGPLKGNENRIGKIDRHRRLARLKFTGHELGNVWAGLEIFEKN